MMTKPNYEILFREAEERDLQGILAIMNEVILNTTSIYDYSPRDLAYVSDWFIKKQRDKMPVLVAEANQQIVGYGSYGIFRAWDAYQFCVEHSIYVHKDYQDHGIGKELMKRLIERARKDGFHTMVAGIDALNVKSCKFHEKLGFFEVGRFREVGYKFDRWLDLIFMQLMLKDKK
jgi:L-amino acid N-acyltransferase YncA